MIIQIPFELCLRVLHALNMFREEKVSVAFRKFQFSVAETVSVCVTVLPFTEFRAHITE